MVSVLAGTKTYLDSNKQPQRIRYVAQESQGRPAGRHDRRLLRRPDPVRRGDAGQAGRRADPDHHLERPVLLARPEQHEPHPRRHLRHPGRRQEASGSTCSSPSASPTACRAARSTRRANFPPCPNFADDACPAAVRLNTVGYPDAATLQLARHASVSTYLKRIKAPTLLVQGQKDTLFNIQEAVATYRGLRAQGTPTRMIWQSWGHSDSTPAPGELDFDAKSLRDSYLGNRFLNWMNHYVKGNRKAPVGSRVLLLPRLGLLRHPPRVRRHRGPQGVRREVGVLPEPDSHALLHRQRRPHHQQRRDAGQCVLRQRGAGAHVVLRDLGARGQHR